MKIAAEMLAALPYWENLTPEEKEAVTRSALVRSFKKGEQIPSSCSGECLGNILVLRGKLRAYILSEEGREITLFRLGQGDPCVLTAGCVISQLTFESHMEAEETTEVLVVGGALFGTLTQQNLAVRCFMYELLTLRFSSVMWTMQQIIFKGFDRRLAGFLIGEYDRTGKAEIRMTHEQIARDIGSAREVVARMLKRFAADGLVELHRGSVTVKNEKALRLLD